MSVAIKTITIVLTVFFSFCYALEANTEKKEQITRQLRDSNHSDEAISLYKEFLNTNISAEDNRATQLDLAKSYVLTKQFSLALAEYDKLLSNNPRDCQVREILVDLYLSFARYDAKNTNHQAALNWYVAAIALDPRKRTLLLREYADEVSRSGDGPEAVILYKEILSSDTSSSTDILLAELGLAKTYTWLNNHKEALNTSDERETHLNLAKAYTEKRLYDDALKEYDNLLIKNKYDAHAKQGKARVYIDLAINSASQDNHREAIEWYYKAIENDPIIRPKLLLKIENERANLDDNDNPPKSKSEIDIEACFGNELPKIKGLPARHKAAPTSSEKIEESKQSYEKALEYAKNLQVFEANRAFEASLALDPENTNYRDHYAWHLHTFSFFLEALFQFQIVLPFQSEKTFYYEVLGFDYRRLGLLEESVWAFSNLYDIPSNLTLNNKYLMANDFYRDSYYAKIRALCGSLACVDEKKALEIKIELFNDADYLGKLEMASSLAFKILKDHPEEYLVHYRYAALLHQKRKYDKALIQFQILMEKLPCNSFLYWKLGKVLEDMGCISSAETAYQYAISLDWNPETERSYARILSKLGDCNRASELSDEIVTDEKGQLTKLFSNAEISLNCGDYENAACIYRSILDQYPYNQTALWGLLKSSTYTRNDNDALLSYTRWPYIWFEEPLQNQLAKYYRPPDLTLQLEYYNDSTTFSRTSGGLNLSEYAFNDIRFFAKSYFTQFNEEHFNTIDRQSIYLGFDKLLTKSWEFHCGLIENYYNNLQHNSTGPSNQPLYSKVLLNCRFHLTYLRLPEFTADIGYDYYDVIDTIPPFDNPIYNYSQQIGATALNIRTRDVKLFLNYNKERIYWLASFVYGKYTDGNVKKTVSFRAGYKFSNLPEFYAYYSYFYLDFNQPAPLFYQNGYTVSAYYDPINLEIHSIGITGKYEFTTKLEAGGELALLYLPKVRNFAYSGTAYFNYKLTDRWSCRLDLRYYYQNQGVIRTGRTGYFQAESANFLINYNY